MGRLGHLDESFREARGCGRGTGMPGRGQSMGEGLEGQVQGRPGKSWCGWGSDGWWWGRWL